MVWLARIFNGPANLQLGKEFAKIVFNTCQVHFVEENYEHTLMPFRPFERFDTFWKEVVLKDNFSLPSSRIYFDDRFRLPYCLRYIRHKEIPGEQGQVSIGGSRVFLLRVLPGFSPPLRHTPLWNTGGDEPRPYLIFCSNEESFLNAIALHRGQERGQLKGSHMPSNRFIDVRLMMEAPEKIRSSCCMVRQGLDCTIPYIPEQQDAFLCSCHDGIDIFVLWNVPRSQGQMIKPTPCIVPYGLPFGASFCGTPSSSRKEIFQTCRKSTSRTVHSIHLGKVWKETVITDIEQPLTGRNLIKPTDLLPKQAKGFDLPFGDPFNQVMDLDLHDHANPMNPFEQLENPT